MSWRTLAQAVILGVLLVPLAAEADTASPPIPTPQWSPEFALPGLDGNPLCAVEYQGDLIVGGNFRHADGVAVEHVARWDGTRWNSMSSGLSQPVQALCVWKGRLVAGGPAMASGTASVGPLAVWDGAAWRPFGPGLSGAVLALHGSDSVLVAGGRIDRAGDVIAHGIARWDGRAWHGFGDGVDGTVYSLTSYRGAWIAGGSFSRAGRAKANSIASWNGRAWGALGDGLRSAHSETMVMALSVQGEDLLAGGQFDTAGSVVSGAIARWDGERWNAFPCPEPVTNAQAFSSDGRVTHISLFIRGNDPADRWTLADWNGKTLERVSPAPDGFPQVLATWRGRLVALGGFQAVGRQWMPSVAMRGNTGWVPVSSPRGAAAGFPSVPTDLAEFEGHLIAAGGCLGAPAAGGPPFMTGVVRWTGQQWEPLGDAFPSGMAELLVAEGNLYLASGSVSRWNGEVWEPVAESPQGAIGSLAWSAGRLWVGGAQCDKDGVIAGLWRLDGARWTPVSPPDGVPDTGSFVTALDAQDGRLFVAWAWGDPWRPHTSIAAWNGEWLHVPGAIEGGRVSSLVHFQGSLCIGGDFKSIDGQPFSGFAMRDASAWRGHGRTEPVDRLVPMGDRLAVCHRGVELFDGTRWAPVGGPVDGQVVAALADGQALWIGGYFESVGGLPAARVARLDGVRLVSDTVGRSRAFAAARPPTRPERRAVAAFTPHQLWDGDNGKTIQRLGLPQQAILVLRDGESQPERVPVPQVSPGSDNVPFRGDWGFGSAALSPAGDAIAYEGISGSRVTRERVVVASLRGGEVTAFQDVCAPSWSPSGDFLAFLRAHLDQVAPSTSESLFIWRRSDGSVRAQPVPSKDFIWVRGDSLLVQDGDQVRELDPISGSWKGTRRSRLVDSPDRTYALSPSGSRDRWVDVIDMVTGESVAGCVADAFALKLQKNIDSHAAPFWDPSPSASHLLFASVAGDPTGPGAPTSWAFGAVDPSTFDVPWSVPGKLVTRTPDGRAVVLLRADSLAVVPLPSIPVRQFAGSARARVEVDVVSWSSWVSSGNGESHVGTWTYDVRAGEWFADHTDPGRCSKFFHVLAVEQPDRVRVEMGDEGRFHGATKEFEITSVPTKLGTNSYDGGYYVTLRTVP